MNYTKYFVWAVLILAVIGGYYYPKISLHVGAVSPVNTTFNDGKVAAINMTPSTRAATSSSILNTDGGDRYVMDNFVNCGNATTSYTDLTGTGLASLVYKAATTSVANQGLQGNTNLVMFDQVATGTVGPGLAGYIDVLTASTSIATSSPNVFGAGAASYQFRWAANSYLTFLSNSTTTSTCTVGVHYIAS